MVVVLATIRACATVSFPRADGSVSPSSKTTVYYPLSATYHTSQWTVLSEVLYSLGKRNHQRHSMALDSERTYLRATTTFLSFPFFSAALKSLAWSQ